MVDIKILAIMKRHTYAFIIMNKDFFSVHPSQQFFL